MKSRFLPLVVLISTLLICRAAWSQPPTITTSTRLEKRSGSFAEEKDTPGLARAHASVSVETSGPKSVAPGMPVTSELIARNNGAVAVARVRVELEIPDGTKVVFAWPAPDVSADRLTWNLGQLEPGAERRLKLELQPAFINELELSPTISYTPAVGLKTTLRQATLAVTQTMPATVGRGGTVDLILQVENKGKESLGRVTLIDYLPVGLKHSLGQTVQEELETLAPGQIREVRLRVVASVSGRWSNAVFVYADGGHSGQSRSTIQVVDQTPSLKLETTSADSGEVQVRVEGQNPGTAPVTGARIVVAVPDGFDYLSSSESGVYDAESRSVRWLLGAISSGAVWSADVRLRPRCKGEWPCQARLNCDQYSEVRTQQTISVRRAAGLTVEVLNHPATLESGAEQVIEFLLLNESATAHTNVRLIARATGSVGFLKVHGPTLAAVDKDAARFEAIGELVAHGRAGYRLRIRGLQPGLGLVQIEVVSDQQQVERQQAEVRVSRDRPRVEWAETAGLSAQSIKK